MRVIDFAAGALTLGCALVLCSCGSSSSGGGGGSPPGDKTPPTFAGVKSVSLGTDGDSRLSVSWDAASDDVSAPSRIVYRVYTAAKTGAEDFTKPFTTLPSGSTSALLSGLTAGTPYFVVVRAVDEAGNEDANVVEKSISTTDGKAPRFAGITQADAKTSRTALVGWKAAHDNGSSASQISYRVYASLLSGMEDFTSAPAATSQPGDSSVLVTGLDPITGYFFVVHAVDAAGNEDSNTEERSVVTPEGSPPIFTGIRLANATPQGIKLYWQPASDNVTETANIVYEIYQTQTKGGEVYTTPTYVTPPGADSYTVTGLPAAQRYYFVARARDTAGNLDSNQNEKTAITVAAADVVAPNFDGVQKVTGSSPTSLLVTWNAATDDVTPQNKILYDVFSFESSDTTNADYSKPTLTAPPGATSAVIAGLNPGATRYIVVRARDQAGNYIRLVDNKSGQPAALPTYTDTTAPTWGTGPTVTVPDDGGLVELKLAFTAATDANPNGATDIRYDICVDPYEPNCLGSAFAQHIFATTDFGPDLSNGITLTAAQGLQSRTRYFVYVRAEDRAGNMETGNHSGTATSVTVFSSDVVPILVDKCSSCHNYYLSATQYLVNKPTGYVEADGLCPVLDDQGASFGQSLCLVSPGRPELSLLYRRINPLHLQTSPFSATIQNNYNGLQEPRDGPGLISMPLSGAEDGAIRDWITQGAYAQ